jgi:hypothetical protein
MDAFLSGACRLWSRAPTLYRGPCTCVSQGTRPRRLQAAGTASQTQLRRASKTRHWFLKKKQKKRRHQTATVAGPLPFSCGRSRVESGRGPFRGVRTPPSIGTAARPLSPDDGPRRRKRRHKATSHCHRFVPQNLYGFLLQSFKWRVLHSGHASKNSSSK